MKTIDGALSRASRNTSRTILGHERGAADAEERRRGVVRDGPGEHGHAGPGRAERRVRGEAREQLRARQRQLHGVAERRPAGST